MHIVADRRAHTARRTPARIWRVLLAASWLLFGGHAAHAQFTRFQNYADEQGLDNLDITAIRQDPAGYMLFGTQGGLYRFDGSAITAFGEGLGLPPAWIRQIAIDPLKRIWVVARDNINILQDGKFVRLGDGTLFSDMEAPLLLAFDSGRVVINNNGTLLTARMNAQQVGPFTPLLDAGTLARLPRLDKTGFVVSTGRDGFAFRCGMSICQLDGGRVSISNPATGLPAEPWQTALASADGTLWVRSLHHLAWRRAGSGTFSVVDIPDRNSNDYAAGPELLTMAANASGRIYTQGGSGLLVWTGSAWRSMPHHLGGLAGNLLQALAFDREGSLWAGSDGAGVYRSIGLGHWEHWTAEDGLPGEIWSTTRLPSGQLWAATSSGTTALDASSPDIPGAASALAGTRNGRLWVAPYGSDLIRLDPAGSRTERFASVGPVRNAFADTSNRLWLCTRNGLVMVADADAPAAAIKPETMLEQSTRQAVESPSGEIWAAATDGLFRLGPDNRFHLVIEHTLLHGRVNGLEFAPDGTVWAYAGGMGIDRFRVSGDHVAVLPRLTKPILPTDNVMFVFRDRRDRMWIGTDRGLAVLDRGRWHHIDSTVGPISNDLNAYGAYEDDDGSMWFSTTRGLSHYLDPTDLPTAPPLHPVITGLSLDSRVLAPVATLHVPSGAGSLSIRFTDLDYAQGRGIAYRYTLVGVDRGWNETTAHEVRYASLPRGKLLFRLAVVDTMHGSVSRSVGFTIKIQAPWWRRWWFFLGCFALIGLVAGIVWRLRRRMLTRRQRRQTDERARLEYLVQLRTAEIEQARSDLQRLAMTDMLTGLPNRRAIMQLLETELGERRENAGAAGVLLCDIDHFKVINDTLGHQAGDEVLAAFGALLRTVAPDKAGRYGGEEFLVILHGRQGSIGTIAQMLFQAIVDASLPIGDTPQPVTASAGMAILRPTDTTATLIARADAALYRAKHNGRNRLEIEIEQREQFALSD